MRHLDLLIDAAIDPSVNVYALESKLRLVPHEEVQETSEPLRRAIMIAMQQRISPQSYDLLARKLDLVERWTRLHLERDLPHPEDLPAGASWRDRLRRLLRPSA